MALVAVLLVTTPIMGLVWIGMRHERQQKERILRDSLQALSIIGISRGRR